MFELIYQENMVDLGSLCSFSKKTKMTSFIKDMNTLRTLIFARHLFSRVHIFAAYIFAPEAPGVNFRYVSIFAWWLFSFFSPENLLEVIFAPVYMLINIVINLTYL